jgi:hypothetical protein
MVPITNFQRNFHSHNDNSYVNNSTSKLPLSLNALPLVQLVNNQTL